jgi:two-component system phosphate regulon sensor histidine kinase PhoR
VAVKSRSPTTVLLHRARLVFSLTALIPTILTAVIGIVLVATHSQSIALVGGILVLAMCATVLTGYVLGTVFVTRGASLASVQNEFLSAVSHELRTPLTSIGMFIDTLREERITDPAERQRCLTVIHQELDRLNGLVDKLLTLSKIESERSAFERRLVSVSEIIDKALVALEALRLGSDVQVRVDVQPGLMVWADPAAMSQAVVNLLANAFKYTPASGKRIEVSVTGDSKHVTISVSDNGPGIALEERELIFEKFRRGAAGRQSGSVGTGLGLAVVRAIVRAHRGKVDVRGEPSAGARFRIVLPRRHVEAT